MTIEVSANCEICSVIRIFNALKHTASPTQQKLKQTISTQKSMCSIFWVKKDVIFIKFMSRNKTVNTFVYSETLKKLPMSFKTRREGGGRAFLVMVSFCGLTMPGPMPLMWFKIWLSLIVGGVFYSLNIFNSKFTYIRFSP